MKNYSNDPYIVQEVMCVACMHSWIAVRPCDVPLQDLECPCCSQRGYVITDYKE